MDIIDGFDVTMVALQSIPPRICRIQDFCPHLFPEEATSWKLSGAGADDGPPPLEAGLRYQPGSRYPYGKDIRSAEQFRLLLNAGLAVPGEKHG